MVRQDPLLEPGQGEEPAGECLIAKSMPKELVMNGYQEVKDNVSKK